MYGLRSETVYVLRRSETVYGLRSETLHGLRSETDGVQTEEVRKM